MRLFRILLKLVGQSLRQPNPLGIRQPLQHQILIAKQLTQFFCGVSSDEFHRISYITITKEAWQILETTYKGTKKVKDTKLQMLITRFEEIRMSEDESFDSFYSKLNEVVIGKFIGRENRGLESCKKNSPFIAGELPCKGDCN